MILSPEQRMEKAMQHLIVFARFVAKEYCREEEADADVLCAAAARVFRYRETQKAQDEGAQPIDWTANHFAQYMRELVIGGPVLPGEEEKQP